MLGSTTNIKDENGQLKLWIQRLNEGPLRSLRRCSPGWSQGDRRTWQSQGDWRPRRSWRAGEAGWFHLYGGPIDHGWAGGLEDQGGASGSKDDSEGNWRKPVEPKEKNWAEAVNWTGLAEEGEPEDWMEPAEEEGSGNLSEPLCIPNAVQ